MRAAPPSKVGRNDPCPCGSGLKAKNCCLAAGPTDAAYLLASQPAPMARLAARWLSAARRRFARGIPLDEGRRARAVQFLQVSRNWNPDAYDEEGRPRGSLAELSVAFNGRAAAVYGALAVGLAHLLLDQPADARPWLETLSGGREPAMLAALAAAGLPAAPFAGLPDHVLSWLNAEAAES